MDSADSVSSVSRYRLTPSLSQMTDDFSGFKDPPNFHASLCALLTFASIVFLCSMLPSQVCGLVSFAAVCIMCQWFRRHGLKLTRREAIFFDEMNLLEVAPNFEFEQPFLTECTTPAFGPERDAPGPSTIWDALFVDDKKLVMQKFYQEHYGPVYETARKRYAEFLHQQKQKREETKTDRSVHTAHSIRK
ncbi:unnamed protein product [Caenorhabditis auriculariae]|uniref:Transmembrane protein n=1 Tax=Caenorhabditis auriculariae TaxID=2777116 RepID=A0A8S1H3W0_9PELO|nr:unnamed protein product [Caenorhabditis auriculariae]